MTASRRWPEAPVIYHVYPRSFRDTTGSGQGDLRGVLHGLDHIAALGVDAVWLSPFYATRFCDGGYDIVEHTQVDPAFGSMADFDAVVARAHDLGLLVMTDMVFNHTSAQHDWFARSCAREDPYTHYFAWADPNPDGSPPSNWLGYFGHPGWRWMPRRQYCLHQFLPCQPCLNHHCDAMRAEQHRILRFWKDRGVDGFRFDAVTAFFHDPGLRDNPPDESLTEPPTNPYAAQRHHYDMMPNDCAAYAADLRAAAGDDMFLLGEINRGEDGMQLAVDFTRHGRLDAAYALDIPESCADGRVIARALEVQAGEDGQAWWMCSHDQPRMIVRAGDGSARDARLFAALHCAMPGALMTYQGEEIGQRQADLPFETLRDPYDRLYWPDVPGRDGARVPLPWDTNAAASGFTVGTPWLPVGRAEAGGIAQQEAEAGSVLGFYRRALALRRRLGLTAAKAQPVEAEADWIAVRLLLPEGSAELCVNFGDAPRALPAGFSGGAPLLTSAEQPEGQVAPRSAAWWQGGG